VRTFWGAATPPVAGRGCAGTPLEGTMTWRLGVDLPERLRDVLPPPATEILVCLAAAGAAIGARLCIDAVFSHVVEFALVFPAVAAATLLAGPRSGAMTIGLCQVLVWYFVLPVKSSFAFATPGEAMSLALSTLSEALLLAFVTGYRSSALRAVALEEARSEALQRTIAALKAQSEVDAQLRRREASLQETRRNLAAIYDASTDGLTLCRVIRDPGGRVIDYQVLEVNKAHQDLTGAPGEAVLAKPVSQIAPPVDPRWFTSADLALRTGHMQQFDVRSPWTLRWLNIRVSKVSEELFQQIFIDVTDRHLLDEQRTRLLQEMSHRVANNFQLMASFLSAQAGSAEPSTRAHLKIAEGRVQVLARLHALLAYAESEHAVNAAAYIEELCAQLRRVIDRPEAVVLSTVLEPLDLDADKIVPIGFIINELVTNALKYAFPPPASGSIEVRLAPEDDLWVLEISDDGVGLSAAGGLAETAGGLGAKLVRTFVAQIDGELSTVSGLGVRHQVRFRP
jgi:two-component sensor histidine kinase